MKTRTLAIALGASLALNLLLAGVIAGAAATALWREPPGLDPNAGLMRLMRFLPGERRGELAIDRSQRRQLRAAQRAMRRSQRDIWEAVRAEPFDRARLAAALARFRTQFADHQEASHALFAGIAAQLSAAERQRFAQTVRHMARHPRAERRR